MNYKQLTEVERYQIYSFLKAGYTQKQVARELYKHPSTISREWRRNKGLKGYRPAQAQRLSEARRREAHKHVKVTEEVCGWIDSLVGGVIRQLIHTQSVAGRHEPRRAQVIGHFHHRDGS